METLTFGTPDDWHVHLRDGHALATVIRDTAKQFGRAVAMPNLRPAVTTTEMALAYQRRIIAARPQNSSFRPLMALYLTDQTSSDDILAAAESPDILGFKLYPAGATTNSEAGVSQIERLYPLFEQLEKFNVPLMIHGEVTDPRVDIFDREAVFIDRHLEPLVLKFTRLRVVLEHITTEEAVDFVISTRTGVGATITPHHLLCNRNALFSGGLRPHAYCLPVLKREHHRQALLRAAASGNPKFFLGTDSAPHPASQKESSCGCAGCYTAGYALELYATAFESVGALHALEPFASHYGPDFYQLPRNPGTITLTRVAQQIPESIAYGDSTLVPFFAGQILSWSLTTPL